MTPDRVFDHDPLHAVGPMPLGKRFAAGFLDVMVVIVLFGTTKDVVFGESSTTAWLTGIVKSSLVVELLWELTALPWFLLWFGLMEGKWGATPGKRLVGARVVRADGSHMGMAASLVRATAIWSLGVVGAFVDLLKPRPVVDMLLFALCFGLLFVRARRANGFASEYDLLTGTRVVQVQDAWLRRRAAERVTSRERMLLHVAALLPMLLFMSAGLLTKLSRVRDADGARLESLVRYVRTYRGTRAPDRVEKRELVATYIADHYGARAGDRRVTAGDSALTRGQWREFNSIVSGYSAATAGERRRATVLVDSTWHGTPPGIASAVESTIATVMLGGLAVTALLAMAVAVALRRGPPMRILGLDFVDARGLPASRLRLLGRQCIAWIPLLFVSGMLMAGWMMQLTAVSVILGAALVGLVAVHAVTLARTPRRGLAEKLSGTMMVPEL